MSLFKDIKNGNAKISVIGLGYVGVPLAVSFSKVSGVIGFDINKNKVEQYKKGYDATGEVGDEAIRNSSIRFTNEEVFIKECKFHIIAVPTPIKQDKTPDLQFIKSSSIIVGRNLQRGSIVVYESTVYPGVTEDLCIPILEHESGLICGVDFKIGYSPERINPGDKNHRLENIVKIVSGMDEDSLEQIALIYGMVIKAGVYKAESIKIAEAAKIIENSQRDINIAFMNELSIIFNKMFIDTKLVLKAANTKWNFLNFVPGLVGGHCIGVDPYYLTYKAEELGYHSQIILAGRKINDDMGKYVGEHTVKALIKANRQIKGSRVAIFGITFKENCPDVRNTKVIDIINELKEYGILVSVIDPVADKYELLKEYGITTDKIEQIANIDAIIIAVSHDEFHNIDISKLRNLYCHDRPVIVDVKGILIRESLENEGFIYWSL